MDTLVKDGSSQSQIGHFTSILSILGVINSSHPSSQMVDLTFDVLGTPDAGHFFFSGGTDGVFLFVKFTPKPGFNVVKVTHGVHVLWEKTGPHLLSLTLHRLGNLPVALLLHFDGSDLHFLFDVSSGWKPVTKFAYEHKLHGHFHHFDPVDFVLDFAHVNPEEVVVVPVKNGNAVTTLFTPGLGKVFVAVKEGDDVLWKAGHAGDNAFSVSVNARDGVAVFARLTVVEAGKTLDKAFEKVGGKWKPLPLTAFLEKRAPKDPLPSAVNLSGDRLLHSVFAVRGARLGLPFDFFLSGLLGKVVAVNDGDDVLWVAEPGHGALHVTLSHDGLHSHVLSVGPGGFGDHGFVKKDGKWVPAGAKFPDHLKFLAE